MTGLVITSLDLFDWSEKNNFELLAGFCFNTPPTKDQLTSLYEVDQLPVIEPSPSVA